MSDTSTDLESKRPAGERLDSWKDIATYLQREVRTVQLWEKNEGLPVHRHAHQKRGTVYAYKREIDAWCKSRQTALNRETSKPSRSWLRAAVVAAGVRTLSGAIWFTARNSAPVPANSISCRSRAIPAVRWARAFHRTALRWRLPGSVRADPISTSTSKSSSRIRHAS